MYFNFAYILSALAVTLIISGYAKAIADNPKFAFTILGLLTILYSYLFIVLQLEDYGFIMGSIGLLVILAIVMYMTRKSNWYEIETGNKSMKNDMSVHSDATKGGASPFCLPAVMILGEIDEAGGRHQ